MPRALTLAVFHRSREVLRHLAPLRRAGHLRGRGAPSRRAEGGARRARPGAHHVADRLDAGGTALAARAARADVIVDMMRMLNMSTDPAMVASSLSPRMSAWFP